MDWSVLGPRINQGAGAGWQAEKCLTLLWVSCWVTRGFQVCPIIVVSLERLQTRSACPGWVCCPCLTLCRGTPSKLCGKIFSFRGERNIAYSMQRLKRRALYCGDIRPVRDLLGSPLVHKVPVLGSGNWELSYDFSFSGQAGGASSLYSWEVGLAAATAQETRGVRSMGLPAEVMARIHLNWYGKDDVKVNLFNQWRETGTLYLTPK